MKFFSLKSKTIAWTSGCGIPKENLDRLFEPFFTTKEVAKGTAFTIKLPVLTKNQSPDISPDIS